MGKSNCFLVFCLFLFLSNECQALSCYNGGVATVFGTTPVYNNITKAECYPEQNFCLTGAFSATFSGFIEASSTVAICTNSSTCDGNCEDVAKQLLSIGSDEYANLLKAFGISLDNTNITSCEKFCCSTDYCNEIVSPTSSVTTTESSKNRTTTVSGRSSGNMAAHVYLVCLGVFMSSISLIFN